MKTVKLGNSGISVSELCLGAMYLGTKTEKTVSYRILDEYVDAGGRFIDTANIYGRGIPGFQGGDSELFLGSWMRERKNRAGLIIASKVGFEMPGVERTSRPDVVIAECEKSLKRLGVDTIDLYYNHHDDRNTPLEATLEAMQTLVQSGKVRVIGASNFSAWRMEEALWISKTHGWATYCCIQQRHTYLRPRPGTTFAPQMAINDDLLDFGRSRPVTLLAYSALLGGAYVREEKLLKTQYVGPDSDARLATLKQVAEAKGVTPSQVILAWMLHSNPQVLPLIAASSTAQLQENLGAVNIHLTPQEMDCLNTAGA